MIRTFDCDQTKRIWHGQSSRKFPAEIQNTARRKLRILNNAQDLRDLRIPPANRLEALHGDREGQHSIRINNQYRVCFEWRQGDAYEVEIVDYHQES
jgi:proteic killer suppression protein